MENGLPKVLVFTTDSCAFCPIVKAVLLERSIAFEEINCTIEKNIAKAAKLNVQSVPTIITDGARLDNIRESHKLIDWIEQNVKKEI